MIITTNDKLGFINGNITRTLPTGSITVNDEIVEDFSYMNNPYITAVTIGPSVEYIGKKAFYNCTGITTLDFSNATSLKYIGVDAFRELVNNESNLDLSNTQIKLIDEGAFYNLSRDRENINVDLGPCKVVRDFGLCSIRAEQLVGNNLEVAGANSLQLGGVMGATINLPNMKCLSGDAWVYYCGDNMTVVDYRQICPALRVLNGRLTLINSDNVTTIYMPDDLRCMKYASWPTEGGANADIYYFGHPVSFLESWGYGIEGRNLFVPDDYMAEWQNDPYWGQFSSQMHGFDPTSV